MKCTKAIIPVAGYGTRRLPITKAIEKCMLPILNRPVVDYVVQDCIRAGITDIYFVISPGSDQIRQYYEHNPELESYLRRNNKLDALAAIQPPPGVSVHFIEQDPSGKYGTAVPVALCREFIPEGESAVVCMGDDCLFYPDDMSSDIARLIDTSGESSGMLAVKMEAEKISQYGVIELDSERNFIQVVEKPKAEDAPSNLIVVSKYLFTSELLDEITAYVKQSAPSGEYFITEPINSFVSGGQPVKVVTAGGKYLDAGNLEGWLYANQYAAAHS